jgi:hypothetical protein
MYLLMCWRLNNVIVCSDLIRKFHFLIHFLLLKKGLAKGSRENRKKKSKQRNVGSRV